ncbi:PA14 domain-containing protein [Aequorivita echinoideorum]|uniref:PA14 domain-containing protein n=1 Tax=Aequorivita echinoideorum TaxID=1549647 RepID=A0ABS5S520_9FLAO|nr:PA14 domain-containing protein [Aequorivita echinoideorum]MBT0607515.1 hypothetical protein [Aequorivita echinoideorum]
MKKTILLPLVFLFAAPLFSQVGIGNTDPAESSLLDVRDGNNNKGILIPRVNIPNLNNRAPITTATIDESLLVYNTNTTTGKGFHYWNGTSWVALQSGIDKNIYDANGSLNQDRMLDLNTRALNIRNGSNPGFRFNSNGSLDLQAYGTPTFNTNSNPLRYLTVNNSGSVQQILATDLYNNSIKDWFEANTTVAPDDISDNIYTNGRVGINRSNPAASLHIYEAVGVPASANNGTILLEHGNDGGASSIVFRSRSNAGSDYAYINYDDNGSGNGTGVENSLLEIGVQNDSPTGFPTGVDDINIAATGSVGISNIAPNGSASLDLGANNRGLLINRVALSSATTATPVTNPANGLLIFNTATAGTAPNNVIPGFYYWINNRWNKINAGDGNNLYNSDGTLTNNRTVNTANFNLNINSVNGQALQVAPNRNITIAGYGSGTKTGTKTSDLAVTATGLIIEEPINRGVQFYSYNITPTVSPNLNTIERETKINRSGFYTGALNNVAAMKPSNNDGFVVKIVGTYEVRNTGDFTFTELCDDGARIYIDGSLIHNVWVDGVGDTNSSTVNLAKGKHKIEFWYYENAGGEYFNFSWGANPDGNSGVIQANQLTIE